MAKHKLLLADDSVTIQKVVNLTFADEGIEVVAVGDGDAAMQKFVESMPDLVMVDVNMPGLDGYRICEMIKQDEETKHIPVILLVGSFEPFDEEEARRVGADDFLTKPFQSIRQLVNKVSDLLNGKTGNTFGDETATVNSFDDTLEMVVPAESAATETFGDAAMDDEMIETNQIGSLPVDEAQKFESVPDSQPPDEDNSTYQTELNDDDEELNRVATEENLPESETLPEEDSSDADDSADQNEPSPRHENIYDFANEQEFADEDESVDVAEINETEANRHFTDEIETVEAQPESAPENNVEEFSTEKIEADENEEFQTPVKFDTTQDFELDDFDLLELPQSKKSEAEKAKLSFNQPKVSDVQTSAGSLSPEEIEAIADKVVEKLSDQVIKKIVREVFTQMTKKK